MIVSNTSSLKSNRVVCGYRCKMRVTRADMMVTVDVTITQQIIYVYRRF